MMRRSFYEKGMWNMKNSMKNADMRAGYLFTMPALLFLVGFILFPIGYNIAISFKEVNMMTLNGVQPFNGLENYAAVVQDKIFSKAFLNTMIFTVASLIFQFLIGFGLALLFSKDFPGNKLARGLMLICWLVPLMAVASVWKWIFASDSSGIINYILLKMHLIREPVAWLLNAKSAMFALVFTNIWRGVPFNMMLIATGLTMLPADVFEAAAIDGAGKWQKFKYMTVPLLKPTLLSVLTLGFIYTFKTFDLVYIMTGGGPLNGTEILATMSYGLTFDDFEFGQGSAVANIMLLVLLAVGMINIKMTNQEEAA